jgi:hypothetical protein
MAENHQGDFAVGYFLRVEDGRVCFRTLPRPFANRPADTSSISHRRWVILIDGRELADLMIEHGLGVRGYRTVEFKRLYEG